MNGLVPLKKGPQGAPALFLPRKDPMTSGAWKRGFARTRPCQHLGRRLPASRNEQKQISVVYKVRRLRYFVVAA